MAVGETEESGRRRWLVDITRWHPSPAQFDAAVSLLPPHEAPAITRFVKEDDRKRAVVSRLLQYSLVQQVLGVPFHRITIRRTAHGKPYLHNNQDATFPSFNFSVSHQGSYVGAASDPVRAVGLDVVCVVSKPPGESAAEFIAHFAAHLTDHEWSRVVRAGAPDRVLAEFYRYWCLKEAYVKAVGAGVGFGLRRLEFRHAGDWTRIYVRVDGEDQSGRWAFRMFKLDETHLAAVATGPPDPEVAVNSSVVEEDEEEEEGFVLLSVEQLMTWLQN